MLDSAAFTELSKVLADDAQALSAELRETDDPRDRRSFIRATFAFYEAQAYIMRQEIVQYTSPADLSIADLAILREETYSINENGTPNVKQTFFPTAALIRFSLSMFHRRFPSPFEPRYGGVGWASLQKAIRVRNRLMHPKSPTDLTVTDQELADTNRSFDWFIAHVSFLTDAFLNHLERWLDSRRSELSAETTAAFDSYLETARRRRQDTALYDRLRRFAE